MLNNGRSHPYGSVLSRDNQVRNTTTVWLLQSADIGLINVKAVSASIFRDMGRDCPFGAQATLLGLFYHPRMRDGSMERELARKTEVLDEIHASVPLCPP
jgi:hypothetical protein